LSVAPQVSGVAKMHLHALEIAVKDLSELLKAIDNVSWQMIEPSSGRVGQVDWEELDDERVIISPAHLASKAVVLQAYVGVSLTVVLNGVA
jgi:hypothetical protein